MTDATPKPSRRRWFRFSLRTLFVVVTVSACWLGWQANIVQGRKTARRQIEFAGGELEEFPGFAGASCGEVWERDASPSPKPSWVRMAMGDAQMVEIHFRREVQSGDLELAAAFPEAVVIGQFRPAKIKILEEDESLLGVAPP